MNAVLQTIRDLSRPAAVRGLSLARAAEILRKSGMELQGTELAPDFAALECPTVFVVGTGAHSGAIEDEIRTVRVAVAEPVQSNERVQDVIDRSS